MVKLYAEFKDKGLSVISVSLDEKKDKWLKRSRKTGLTWLHLSDLKGWKGEIVKLYNIDGVPTIFVLDENNRIIAKNLRGEKLRALVEETIKVDKGIMILCKEGEFCLPLFLSLQSCAIC